MIQTFACKMRVRDRLVNSLLIARGEEGSVGGSAVSTRLIGEQNVNFALALFPVAVESQSLYLF